MSTTRWIIETPCEHDEYDHHVWYDDTSAPVAERTYECEGGSRIVVDPANLPPEAIQRAAQAIYEKREGAHRGNEEGLMILYSAWAEAAVTAFLSDPEPGDQT